MKMNMQKVHTNAGASFQTLPGPKLLFEALSTRSNTNAHVVDLCNDNHTCSAMIAGAKLSILAI